MKVLPKHGYKNSIILIKDVPYQNETKDSNNKLIKMVK